MPDLGPTWQQPVPSDAAGKYVRSVVNPLAIATFPLTLAHHVETLLGQLGNVASRAAGLLDTAEPVAGRIEALTSRAEAAVTNVERLTDVVDGVSARAQSLASEVDSLVARAAGIAGVVDEVTAGARTTLDTVQPLVESLRVIDATALKDLLDDAVALIPALAALPPVIARLAEQVDHLDKTVGEVSALLQGVPGAARLVRRGAGLTGR
jgi:ABC-type transporter Mla subunit MlaD